MDLFSGAGGLSLGLQDAGWTVAASVDNNEKALQTHRHNFAGLALDLDLADPGQRRSLVGLLRRTKIDLLAGGPPCQPFSRAGRSKIRSLVLAGHREEHDHRRELWQAFLDVALALRPRAVLMENVPDMALGDDFSVMRTMVDALERGGYHTQLKLADAWRYGVPQHRKRLLLLARRDCDHFSWPTEKSEDEQTTLYDAIGDLPALGGTTGGRQLRYRKPRNLPGFGKLMRADAPSGVVWDHMTRPVRDDDREIFALMDSTTLYSDLPEKMRRYSADTFDDKYKKLDWNSVSRSITAHIAKDGYWYIHPEEHRTLTVREAARIQTFPDWFRFAGTRSDAFRQIGNAVPPLLGRAAAAALLPVSKWKEHDSGEQSRWMSARKALTSWARQQRSGQHWYALPGPGVTVAVAAVAAVLLARTTAPKGIDKALAVIRGRARVNKAELDQVQQELRTKPGRAAVQRFRPLLPKRNLWHDPELMVDGLAMKPAEERIFRLLCNDDVLLATQSTLRVAARVAGTDSDRTNRLSNGRVDLARLVGAGPEAPLRAAALRLLGSTVCRTLTAQCAECPLRQHCPGSSQG
ncbi:DNA cytosine methyltransferase [Saccharopolyspora shandongensis]|uniref:DNA cytosine methyltransferase n=1 Tax=Saccharopolyspora shandongensis TaxID=418495 RepID=UPI003442D813